MSSYKLSNRAEADLRGIYRYTQLHFGAAKAAAYLTGIDECLALIADSPLMAQDVDNIRSEYRRYLYREHALYFVDKGNYIYVVRVLHQQMNVKLHLD